MYATAKVPCITAVLDTVLQQEQPLVILVVARTQDKIKASFHQAVQHLEANGIGYKARPRDLDMQINQHYIVWRVFAEFNDWYKFCAMQLSSGVLLDDYEDDMLSRILVKIRLQSEMSTIYKVKEIT